MGEEAWIVSPARPLDQPTEQIVAAVAVCEGGARGEIEIPLNNQIEELVYAHLVVHQREELLFHEIVVRLAEHIRHPGRVAQELPDRDGVVTHRQIRQVLPYRVVQRQRPPLDEEHHRYGSKALGLRSDPIHHLGADRNTELEIGETVSSSENDRAVSHNDDRRAQLVRDERRGKHTVDLLLDPGLTPTASGQTCRGNDQRDGREPASHKPAYHQIIPPTSGPRPAPRWR